MDIRFQAGGPSGWSADAVIVFLFEGETPEKACPELIEAAPWLGIAPAMRDFHGKKDQIALIYGPPSMAISRVLAMGLGKKEASFTKNLAVVRKAAGAAAVRCRELGLETFATPVSSLSRLCDADADTGAAAKLPSDIERVIEETVCGVRLGLYRNTGFKAEPEMRDPRWFGLLFCDATVPDIPRLAARRGETHADGVVLARRLANTPANHLSPEGMAEEARKLARRHGMRCEVLERPELEHEGMGALLCVGAGSINEPRLVILEHAPAGHADDAPLVIVGKGITFDSGGISIKPSAGMWEMKGDMGGSAAVLGLFEALGQLETPRRVIGILACAENMPDAKASRPGDVYTTFSGKTVEIISTDAEGRLVLCDALAYAQKRWSPTLLVDVATLTGACVVALGDDVAGLFTHDEGLARHVCKLGEIVGEPFWQLPLDDRYFEHLKSETADFCNSGAREGGASTAAIFLKQFIAPDTRWLHLDIAGPGFVTRNVVNCPKGGTGFSVRTLIELVTDTAF